ncbi:hypothetical protein OPKNFCMD_4178 [Methylobacterium crusticola]|uniref:DUF6894 domain-containing protein n=1 Tax=Methylobacterium crusticola TaxID=1697972 RepID=A0ABQ4R3J5_9HYPH|nr:hypothetical protein OPKNFCMD_4178 [Methylobacterium crusticola]
MARYRFHCTNGSECVLDTTGAVVRNPGRLALRAREVARDVMRSLDDRADWSEWRVTVHDLSGRRVLQQAFAAAGSPARSVGDPARSVGDPARSAGGRDGARPARRAASRAGAGHDVGAGAM